MQRHKPVRILRPERHRVHLPALLRLGDGAVERGNQPATAQSSEAISRRMPGATHAGGGKA